MRSLKLVLLTTLIGAALMANDEPMTGGFAEAEDTQTCYNLLAHMVTKGHMENFSDYVMLYCEQQVVAGMNYRLALYKEGGSPEKCFMTIHVPLDHTEEPVLLKNRNGEEDCYYGDLSSAEDL